MIAIFKQNKYSDYDYCIVDGKIIHIVSEKEFEHMISIKEYRVLCMIKQIKDEEKISAHTSEFILKNKIDNKISALKIQDYELNEIMRSLNRQEYICNLFNTDTNAIYGTEITDSGLVAIKNFKKDLTKYIFKRYIWVLFTIVLTALLTGYFTSFFTK